MWKWDTFIDFAKSGIQGESWYQGKNKGSKFKTHNPNIELMSEIELKLKKKEERKKSQAKEQIQMNLILIQSAMGWGDFVLKEKIKRLKERLKVWIKIR